MKEGGEVETYMEVKPQNLGRMEELTRVPGVALVTRWRLVSVGVGE